jgi:hypothetical protein
MVFDPISALIMFAIALAMQVVAYLLMPKPKQPKPDAARDLENPVAEAGKPIPVVFGTVTVKGLNVLWFGDKQVTEYEINV